MTPHAAVRPCWRRLPAAALILASSIALAACLVTPPGPTVRTSLAASTPAASDGGVVLSALAGRIVFDNHDDIFVVRPDGSGLVPLTQGPAHEFDASWSADGEQIVYRVDTDTGADIWLMRADGSNQRRLVSGLSPAWSPRGDLIAFADDQGTISVIPPGGGGQRQLAGTDQGEYPCWSPDGTRVAYSNVFPDHKEIYLIAVDGGSPLQLTDSPGADWQVAWSPSGDRLAFTSERDHGENVYTMAADGSDVRRLTTTASYSPAWSPDGRFIVYGAGPLYVMAADGSGRTRLPIDVPGELGAPDWHK